MKEDKKDWLLVVHKYFGGSSRGWFFKEFRATDAGADAAHALALREHSSDICAYADAYLIEIAYGVRPRRLTWRERITGRITDKES